MAADEPPDTQKVHSDIATEIVRVQRESYGAGVENVQVHVEDDLVVVILDIELAPAESTLIAAGHGEAVKKTREAFQEAIAPTFSAVVERATGRRVVGFLSSISLDPLFTAEVFRLAPHD